MNAIVTVMITNLHAQPNTASELLDEVLYGMPVRIVEELEDDWVRVRTAYCYEGYCQKAHLLIDEAKTTTWIDVATFNISQSFADILQEPRIQSTKIMTLVRGSIVRNIHNEGLDAEWAMVQLATGETGYLRKKWLQEKVAENSLSEQSLRENIVTTALSYLATPYRWGGKSPFGIDCSGLCSMAYLLNGIHIYRDAKIVEGFPIHEITFDQVRKGDLLYFPGHIAMYLGDKQYVHASIGGNEVNINSLDEQHPLFRNDLTMATMTAVGSIFGRHKNGGCLDN